MTIEDFNRRHGVTWKRLKSDPIFEDLKSVLNDVSPARRSCAIPADTSTVNAQYLLGTIAGFNSAIDLLDRVLGVVLDHPEPLESSFVEEPQENETK